MLVEIAVRIEVVDVLPELCGAPHTSIAIGEFAAAANVTALDVLELVAQSVAIAMATVSCHIDLAARGKRRGGISGIGANGIGRNVLARAQTQGLIILLGHIGDCGRVCRLATWGVAVKQATLVAINAASAAVPTSGIFDSLRIRGCGTYMRDLALLEWSGLIFANDTSDARYHVSHFRQRRVSFLRIRDAAEILSQLKGHFWDVFSVECLIGKLHPISSVDSGTHFPLRPSTGNRIPL